MVNEKKKKGPYLIVKRSKVYHIMSCGCEAICGIYYFDDEGDKVVNRRPQDRKLCSNCKKIHLSILSAATD